MRLVLKGIALAAALLVFVGFLSPFHLAADTLSIGRPIFGLMCVLGVFVAQQIWQRMFFASTVLVAFASLIGFFMTQDPGGDIRIYSKNLLFANTETDALIADIKTADVDVVMLQEVSGLNIHILAALKGDFPHQHLCRFSTWLGVAVVSRHAFDGVPDCSAQRAISAAPIRLDGKPVWLVSAHIPWPWPKNSGANVAATENLLEGLDGAVVIAGDFNMIPWSARVARFASVTRTQLAGPVRPTFSAISVPLPIDMALAPGGGFVSLRPTLGSDHAGIVADLKLWVQ